MNTKQMGLIVAIVATGIFSQKADAQQGVMVRPTVVGVGGFGNGWNQGWYHHASTLEEGIQRGYASIVTAQGQYNLATSAAMVNYEAARAQYLQNYRQAQINRYEAKKRKQELENARRQSAAERQEVAIKPNKRLGLDQFNPELGVIHWPLVLRDEAFDEARLEINTYVTTTEFKEAYSNAEPMPEFRRLIEDLKSQFSKEQRRFSGNERVLARSFLDGLMLEARSPLKQQLEQLANN